MQSASFQSEYPSLFTIFVQPRISSDVPALAVGSEVTLIYGSEAKVGDQPETQSSPTMVDVKPLTEKDVKDAKPNVHLPPSSIGSESETFHSAKPLSSSSTIRHAPALPALPLLRYMAESAMSAQRRLLKLVLLPPKLLDDAIRNDPESVAILGFPLGTKVTAADLIDRIKHLQYTALQALLAAYRYGEARVDIKDKVILGLQIGRLALDMLGTLQREMQREEKLSAKRKRPVADDEKDRIGKTRKTSVGAGSPHSTATSTPTQSRHKPVKPSPLRRNDSTRDDFAAAGSIDAAESEADLVMLQRANARKQEGSRLLKETEDILSSAVSLSRFGRATMATD